ncbi:helix-turn-helix domain-containing protein [Brevibacterium picturae]|uniref:Helix-turn-helix domain-containing protein n=1 Tax=Brevibacterium picturae TaxID=260553 RepID=A0ABP4MWJ8_9MICO
MSFDKTAMEISGQTPDDLLFIDEVAEMLRLTPASLRGLMHTGRAPASAKVGRRRVFRRSEVNAWVDAQFKKASA